MKVLVLSFFAAVLGLILSLSVWGYNLWQFDVNCQGHIKRAADANSVKLAQKELKIAVDYLTENGLTQGNTSLLFETPSNDIGFWYANLTASLDELNGLVAKSDAQAIDGIEQTNALIKLRESLLDHGQTESVTHPAYICLYPNHQVWMWMMFVTGAIVISVLPLGKFMED